MIKLEATNKSSIVQQIIKSVEIAIVNKELRSGDLFPSENELVKTLGVSKSSVREAVKMLEAMGVLEIKKGEGTFVKSAVASEVINPMLFSLLLQQEPSAQIIELRRMFEPAYSQLAMENMTASDIETLTDELNRFKECVRNKTANVNDDMKFHRLILQATHNEYVIRIGNIVLELFKVTVSNALFLDPDRSYKMHENLLTALKEKNLKRLNEVISESLNKWS